LNVTLNVATPFASCAGAGNVALASDARTWTEWVTPATGVHVSSQALTVIENGTPTVWARGVPVLPDGVRGAAVSPGNNTWSRVNGPAEGDPASVAASDAASTSEVAPERSSETSERTMTLPREARSPSRTSHRRYAPRERFEVERDPSCSCLNVTPQRKLGGRSVLAGAVPAAIVQLAAAAARCTERPPSLRWGVTF